MKKVVELRITVWRPNLMKLFGLIGRRPAMGE